MYSLIVEYYIKLDKISFMPTIYPPLIESDLCFSKTRIDISVDIITTLTPIIGMEYHFHTESDMLLFKLKYSEYFNK
jgi:hypothetical protein